MPLETAAPMQFILSAFDLEQWCPVLQAKFTAADLGPLRAALGLETGEEIHWERIYEIEPDDLQKIVETYGACFSPDLLETTQTVVWLFKRNRGSEFPYLPHGGYELPLLIDGRKKLAVIWEPYPPMRFEGEDRFDRWVEAGLLHREESLEPLDKRLKPFVTSDEEPQGDRKVYYTPKGEEWRIRAMQLVWQAAEKSPGWNEHFERIEGMLYGYEDWQNDWWIKRGLSRGGFGGSSLCCAVNAAGMAWLESAGFRALPPLDKPVLSVCRYEDQDLPAMRAFMREESDSVALVCFAIPLYQARDLLSPSKNGTRWLVPSHRVPDLNQHLRNTVVVALRRDLP